MTKELKVTIASLAAAVFVGFVIGFFVAFGIFSTPKPTETMYTQTEVDELLQPVLQYESDLQECQEENAMLNQKIDDILTILVPVPVEHTGVDMIGVDDGTSD